MDSKGLLVVDERVSGTDCRLDSGLLGVPPNNTSGTREDGRPALHGLKPGSAYVERYPRTRG